MYTPSIFNIKEEKDKVAFMKKYSFGTIITNKGTLPIATQLPFVVEERNGKVILTSHFGAVNEQAAWIDSSISLIVFSEPHAYISPSHYEKWESVPTWDYISVHAYGKAKIIDGEVEKLQLLEKMILEYEKEYMNQWETLSDKFKTGMAKGIVAFEIEVSELQGQAKLSQNKSKIELERITNHLNNSEIGTERDLGSYMEELI